MSETDMKNEELQVLGLLLHQARRQRDDLLAVLEAQGHTPDGLTEDDEAACGLCNSLWPCPAAQAIAKAKGESENQ